MRFAEIPRSARDDALRASLLGHARARRVRPGRRSRRVDGANAVIKELVRRQAARVRICDRVGGGRRDRRPGDGVFRALNLEPGLVGRVVRPGEVDAAA